MQVESPTRTTVQSGPKSVLVAVGLVVVVVVVVVLDFFAAAVLLSTRLSPVGAVTL